MINLQRLEYAVRLLVELSAYKKDLQDAAEAALKLHDQHPNDLEDCIQLRHLLAARDHGTLTVRLNAEAYRAVLKYLQEQPHELQFQQETAVQENADA